MNIKYLIPEDKSVLFWIIPFLILLSPVIIVIGVFEFFAEKFRKKEALRFNKENEGKQYFFYKKKRGWGDFVINNMIPIISPIAEICDLNNDDSSNFHIIYSISRIFKVKYQDMTLPLFVQLSEEKPIFYSMNKEFNELKRQPKKSEEAQGLVIEVLKKQGYRLS